MDDPNIRRSNFIQTYYSGRETPAAKKTVFSPRQNKVFDKRLWIETIFLLALVSGAVISIIYFLGIKARPIDISRAEIPALSSGGDYNNIGYYHYQQVENRQVPIMLKPGRICAAVNFGKVMDLTSGVVSFSAKGGNGTEKVAIIIRDTQRMSNANQSDIILTPVLLNDEWQRFDIKLKDLYLPLDKSSITQVRFDASAKLTKNNSGARAYIKEIIIK